MPPLPFDKVALRLVQSVRGALEGVVPDGIGVVFAVTAPIREPAKTIASLIETIRARLPLGSGRGEHAETLYGNAVRVRVVARRSPRTARIAGFVHNPEPPPNALLDLAQALLEGAEPVDVSRSEYAALDAGTLQRICEQVFDAAALGKPR